MENEAPRVPQRLKLDKYKMFFQSDENKKSRSFKKPITEERKSTVDQESENIKKKIDKAEESNSKEHYESVNIKTEINKAEESQSVVENISSHGTQRKDTIDVESRKQISSDKFTKEDQDKGTHKDNDRYSSGFYSSSSLSDDLDTNKTNDVFKDYECLS